MVVTVSWFLVAADGRLEIVPLIDADSATVMSLVTDCCSGLMWIAVGCDGSANEMDGRWDGVGHGTVVAD